MAESAYIEGSVQAEAEGGGGALSTRAGFEILIDPSGLYCKVSFDGRMESPRDKNGVRSSLQAIPYLYFIGGDLEPVFPAGQIELAMSRGGRIHIPFRHYPDRETRQFTIRSYSGADQFPVFVGHYETVKDLFAQISTAKKIRAFALLDPETPRIDLITLKVKRPDLTVLLLHSEVKLREKEEELSRARAGDVVRHLEPMSELRGDPVFLARIHLRNLDLEATRDLLLTNELTSDEIQFIRTFLSMMIRNEKGDRDLMAAKNELELLDEFYRLGTKLLLEEVGNFDEELDRGIDPSVAENLVPFIKKLREKADSKDDEIYLWEVEYRLGQIAREK